MIEGTSSTPKVPNIFDHARMRKLYETKKQRITRKIAAYLVKEMRPYSTVESEFFRYDIFEQSIKLKNDYLESTEHTTKKVTQPKQKHQRKRKLCTETEVS